MTVCLLLIAAAVPMTLTATQGMNPETTQLLYSFTFNEPDLYRTTVEDTEYTLLQMPGCLAIGKQAGSPMLPVKSVKLVLPAMTTVTKITVTGTPVEVAELDAPVFPYQNEIPFGFEPEPFQLNTAVYASDVMVPLEIYDGYQIGYSRGYAIMDMTLNPVRYIPGEGRLFYYPEISVTIDLEDTGVVNQFFRNHPDDQAWVQGLVYNPEVAETYMSDLLTGEYPGGLCDPKDDYEYVIITTTQHGLDYWLTNDTIPYNWESLLAHHAENGLRGTLVTVQNRFFCVLITIT
jgi:hypothetical protein